MHSNRPCWAAIWRVAIMQGLSGDSAVIRTMRTVTTATPVLWMCAYASAACTNSTSGAAMMTLNVRAQLIRASSHFATWKSIDAIQSLWRVAARKSFHALRRKAHAWRAFVSITRAGTSRLTTAVRYLTTVIESRMALAWSINARRMSVVRLRFLVAVRRKPIAAMSEIALTCHAWKTCASTTLSKAVVRRMLSARSMMRV